MQLLIYTPVLAPRVDYIFSVLLQAAGLDGFKITIDRDLFKNGTAAKINYSSTPVSANEFWIVPAGLLIEDGIKEQVINCFAFKEVKAFFKTSESDFPFDIFAASFYLLSRYEEYLPHKKDMYGRFAHENSLAFKEDFLKLPLVNNWMQHFIQALLYKFPSLHCQPKAFSFLPTYDIDIAWSYKNKGLLRNAGGLLHSMTEAEWAKAGERINVLFGNAKDPFDTYDWLSHLHKKYSLNPLYFFLVAQKVKGYDKNIRPAKKPMKQLIRKISSEYAVGIHPSWQSGDRHELLKEEIVLLQKITGRSVTQGRQHYIRMTLPETCRRLIADGITEDYSMGYGSINGFRASYCLPYKWYDLQNEQQTPLTIYPFCFMEANAYYEQHLSCSEALEEMYHYYEVTKAVKGFLITIWHNHFLGTDSMFAGWKDVYETFIKKVSQST